MKFSNQAEAARVVLALKPIVALLETQPDLIPDRSRWEAKSLLQDAEQDVKFGYNGWANYETWLVNMDAADDTEGMREMVREAKRRASKDGASAGARIILADLLKERYEDEEFQGSEVASLPSLWSSLLGAGLSEVDWLHLAGHYIGDFDAGEEG